MKTKFKKSYLQKYVDWLEVQVNYLESIGLTNININIFMMNEYSVAEYKFNGYDFYKLLIENDYDCYKTLRFAANSISSKHEITANSYLHIEIYHDSLDIRFGIHTQGMDVKDYIKFIK
jgi:hypothetical protein